ncbi:hypothetical protein EVAR_25895_1 [Eumeta japonica]|uniref:Uncharacterized protein n=1 Tax=Eumeta variegata TaxID=151549 RepID=A0A4C1W2V0_EUMVA|nr:hypothetical protein EVAR_25895_1 [Eumeta japonica]
MRGSGECCAPTKWPCAENGRCARMKLSHLGVIYVLLRAQERDRKAGGAKRRRFFRSQPLASAARARQLRMLLVCLVL